MSNVRAIQRKMKKDPPAPAPVQATSQNPLEGKDYRVRRLIIKAEIDIYTPNGVLQERGFTDDLVILEANFPQAIMAYFIQNGMLVDGFKTYVSPTPSAAPPKE